MKLEDVIDPALAGDLTDVVALGIDIGSRGAKAALIDAGELHVVQAATGVSMQATAEELLEELLGAARIPRSRIAHAVGTGYGRVALRFEEFPTEIVTEISCHAMGAHFLDARTRTIVDIGGQDSKVIQVDPATGKVVKFIMNDKCAAGTGRFLEKAAGLLEYTIHEIGPASLQATRDVAVSSQCVVFAESEIISLRARGESRENVAAGLHLASARRVKNLLARIPLEASLVFTGGVANNVGMRHALERLVGHPFATPRLDTIYAGALGAAVYAQRRAREARRGKARAAGASADLGELVRRTAEAERLLVERTDVKKVGYLCNYTPVELLSAAGVGRTRLLKCGEPEVVSKGEQITKSVFCDFTKSVLGHFAAKDPLYSGLDEVVTFYTCDSMKATAEAIDKLFLRSRGYVVPRAGARDAGRRFFRQEILNLRQDLEALTGGEIGDDELAEEIRLYNRVRALVRKISALRKRENPPLDGRDFLEITRAFHLLEPEELIVRLGELHDRLAAVPEDGPRPLRLMMTGGIVAEGDRRILDLLEDEIGARVVVEDHCTGLSPFRHDTDERGDPWQALANAYLDQAPCARQTPLATRVEHAAELAREYRVDGVVYTYLKFCPCYGMTKSAFLRRFQEMELPVLELGNDYSRGDIGQIKTRLEAFVEVLHEKEEV